MKSDQSPNQKQASEPTSEPVGTQRFYLASEGGLVEAPWPAGPDLPPSKGSVAVVVPCDLGEIAATALYSGAPYWERCAGCNGWLRIFADGSISRSRCTCGVPRRFRLIRNEDETGISGTGIIASGVQFADGQCVLRWRTAYRSTGIYASIEELEHIYGHGGKTVVEWVDQAGR